ncbi:MAG: SAM-dependent chlorinase/fluorinase [Chloroflexi bacterium]|nr:SAM-dependent chlorinase/fluorinase [Chloroflexota bacterium]
MTPRAGCPAIVTLLTDFGASDAYAGVMKGVMLGINPSLAIVDLTQDVRPQDVLQGAFLLGTAWRYFPPGAIHVAVVDPGVGTDRRALLAQGEGHTFLAPDNGLLSFVLRSAFDRPSTGSGRTEEPFAVRHRPLPPGFHAYALTNPHYWLPKVSSTFHGRDVFAPVAAHLSLGAPPEEMGEPVSTVATFLIPQPRWEGGRLVGCVLHVDRFGNIVTNVTAEAVAGLGANPVVEVGGKGIRGLSATYGAGSGLVALTGSHGYLEIALVNGDAARALGVKVGDAVAVRSAT